MQPSDANVELHRSVALKAGYVLAEKLGEGTYKICYAAIIADGGNPCAFKVIKPNAQLSRSQRELEAMQKCSHPNIARCIAHGTMDQVSYIVEDLFRGGDLSARLANGPVGPKEAVRLGYYLIRALSHLRSRKLVHRDIKPANIMFSSDAPVLTDLGVVRALDEVSLTASWQVRGPGTVTFMPPEQYHNQKSLIDWRADQFALGITLAMAAFGSHPFGASPQTIADAIAQHQQPSKDFEDAASSAGLSILVKMIQPYPVERFSDPEVLAEEWSRLAK